jgi:hypothetical protein
MKPLRIGKNIPLFVTFVLLLSSYGCKKNDDFNIVGNWRIHAVSSDGAMDEDYFLSFQGDEWSGDIYESGLDTGDYLVFSKTVFVRNVAFSFRHDMSAASGYRQLSFGCEVHSGHDSMNGSFSSYYSNLPQALTTGTWNGTRQ